MTRVVMLLAAFCLSFSMFACGEAPQGPPRPLVDGDGDGIANNKLGGRDCNDNDPSIPGGLTEVAGNSIDDNCNGQTDELWVKTGYWRLTTPGQSTSRWDIDLHTDNRTAIQHVRCLQFKFQLQSTVDKRIYYITQWQTGLPSTSISIVDNKFTWKLNNETLKIEFNGEITGETTMKGTIAIANTDPNVNASAQLPFTGRFVTTLSKDKAEQEFCGRCYGEPTTCKATE